MKKKYVSNSGCFAKLSRANVVTKRSFDAKIIELENIIKKLQIFDSSYFRGESHFEEDGTQNYLIFQPLCRYFKVVVNTDYVLSSKSKGLSNESIKPPTTSDNNLTPALCYYDNKVKVKFTGSYLKQTLHYYHHKNIVNIYTVYELGASASYNSDPTLKNCLFGAVTLTKNAVIDKYGYSGYGIGFDIRSSFSFRGSGFGQNVLIFGVDMSSSACNDNKKKDILILGKGPTQGLEHTLTAKKMYSISFNLTKNFFA